MKIMVIILVYDFMFNLSSFEVNSTQFVITILDINKTHEMQEIQLDKWLKRIHYNKLNCKNFLQLNYPTQEELKFYPISSIYTR